MSKGECPGGKCSIRSSRLQLAGTDTVFWERHKIDFSEFLTVQ